MRKIVAVALTAVMVLSVLGSGLAFAGNHMNQERGPPHDIGTWTSTTEVPQTQMNGEASTVFYDSEENESLLRVDEEHVDNTTINVTQESIDNETQLTVDIHVTGNATNVTFFVQTQAVEDNVDNISAIDLLLDGEEHEFYVDEDGGPGNSPWALFRVPEFSERSLTFASVGESEGGPVGTFSQDGLPEGVEAFLNTEPLTGDDVDTSKLAGKIRVSSNQTGPLNVTLEDDGPGESVLVFNSTLNESTTVFIQKSALESSANVSNVNVMLDGEPVQHGLTEQGGGEWIAFEIDHFSEREVTVQSAGGGGPVDTLLNGTTFGIPNLVLVGAVIFLVSAGFYVARRKGYLGGDEDSEMMHI